MTIKELFEWAIENDAVDKLILLPKEEDLVYADLSMIDDKTWSKAVILKGL